MISEAFQKFWHQMRIEFRYVFLEAIYLFRLEHVWREAIVLHINMPSGRKRESGEE